MGAWEPILASRSPGNLLSGAARS